MRCIIRGTLVEGNLAEIAFVSLPGNGGGKLSGSSTLIEPGNFLSEYGLQVVPFVSIHLSKCKHLETVQNADQTHSVEK